jgi:DNA-damage-inducible protein D
MSNNYRECVSGFEEKKRLTDSGIEYWMARDIMPLLAYASWDKFEGVIGKAQEAARSAGAPAENHFSQTGNMVMIGSGAKRQQADWFLSRYACYLIAMSADSSKAEVGHAMTYFAGKTRQMELLEKQLLGEQDKRVQLRLRTIVNNKRLAGAAKKAGVINYGLFQDAGYRGFYGGMGIAEIKQHKGIAASEELLDRVGPLELAAHDFRITLTEERLNRDSVRTEGHAISTHKQAGSEVRAIMQKDDGKNPEDLPVDTSIKRLVHQHRKQIGNGEARN